MPQRCHIFVRLIPGAGLALFLMVLVGLPTSYAGPGPNPVLLLTPTPTAAVRPGPRITMFRATPDMLVAGESFLLEWRSVNATRALLFADDLPHQGPVPPTGSIGFKDVPAGTYGLRLVVQNDVDPPQSDEAALIVDVAEPAGVVIVDDVDAEFIRHGSPDFWFEADIGYGNRMIWTYVNGDAISNWIEWRPDLPVCGIYAVSAFIPSQNATTQEARYEVYHTHRSGVMPADESPRVIVADQSAYSDEWVTLGSYKPHLYSLRGEKAHELKHLIYPFSGSTWNPSVACDDRAPSFKEEPR